MKKRISAAFDFSRQTDGGWWVVHCHGVFATMFYNDMLYADIVRRLGKRSPMYFRLKEFGK